jgi:tetratricopeptide (TPR) repeat protein
MLPLNVRALFGLAQEVRMVDGTRRALFVAVSLLLVTSASATDQPICKTRVAPRIPPLGEIERAAAAQPENGYDVASAYEELIDEDGESQESLERIAILLLNSSLPESAASVASYAISKDRRNARAFFVRALAYKSMGCSSLALDDLKKAEALDPRVDNRTNLLRGQIYLSSGDHERAVEAFTVQIEKGVSREDAYEGRAEANKALGQYQEALSDYRALIEIKQARLSLSGSAKRNVFVPGLSSLYLDVGEVLFLLERQQEAITAVEQAIAYDKYNAKAHYILSQLLAARAQDESDIRKAYCHAVEFMRLSGEEDKFATENLDFVSGVVADEGLVLESVEVDCD